MKFDIWALNMELNTCFCSTKVLKIIIVIIYD